MKVFVAMRPVDFRKGIDGLALAVQEMFGLDPFCGAVFVFRSKRADRIKLLVWDQTGMVLVHKRLEGGKFVWPQVQDGVMRVPAIEAALKANWSAGAIDNVKVSANGLMSDIHGTSDYRANLVKVMAQRAVTAAG